MPVDFKLTQPEAAAIAAAAAEFLFLKRVLDRGKAPRDVERLRRFASASAALLSALDDLQNTREMSALRAAMRETYGANSDADSDATYSWLVSAILASRRLSEDAGFPVGDRRKTQPNWAAHVWARCALKHWEAAGLRYGKAFSASGRFPQALSIAAKLHGVPNASDREVLKKAIGGA